MISQNQKNWQELRQRLKRNTLIEGSVIRVKDYGVFLDINETFLGYVLLPQISDNEYTQKEDFPSIGDVVKGVIIDFSENINDYNFAYISVSLKQSVVDRCQNNW